MEPLKTRIERRPLTRLRNGTLIIMACSLEDINFGSGPANERAAVVHGSKIDLTRTGATRQSLTREVQEVTVDVLVVWIA